MAAEIHNRGRGPEILGTRITVYDVMEYYLHGEPRHEIASLLRLTADELEAAIDYIDLHLDELRPIYDEMVERGRRGNSPEIVAMLNLAHEKLMDRKRELEAGPAGS